MLLQRRIDLGRSDGLFLGPSDDLCLLLADSYVVLGSLVYSLARKQVIPKRNYMGV